MAKVKPYFTAKGDPMPLQDEDELMGLITLAKIAGVKSYLEIGACYGGTFKRIVQSLPAGAKAVALDNPEQKWGRKDSLPSLQAVTSELCSIGYDALTVIGDSTNEGVMQAVACHGPYDLVLIDADHTYEGVKADWLRFSPLAKFVAFHDIVCANKDIGVPQFWGELKAGNPLHVELIGKQAWLGIGFLAV